MRLLMISQSQSYGGAEALMERISRHVADAGHEVAILGPAPGARNPEPAFRVSRGPIARRLWDPIRHAIACGSHVCSYKPSAVFHNIAYPDGFLAISVITVLLEKPYLAVFHACPNPNRKFGWLTKHIASWTRRRGAKWVTVSDYNRRALASAFGVAPESIKVIPNGVDLSRFNAKKKTNDIRKAMDWPADAFVIITVARLDEGKGYQNIIPSLDAVRAEHPDARFLWIGDGPYRPELERMLEPHHDIAVLAGGYPAEDIPNILAQGNLFLFPSLREGMPLALLEAMAAGLPILCSDATCMPEIVHEGREGRLFRAGDATHLQEKLLMMLREREVLKRMGKEARLNAEEYSEERMLSAWFARIRCTARI